MSGRLRLFIATPTHTIAGGVERILESLATGLPPHGFDVVFGLAHGLRFHDPKRFRDAFPVVQGIELDARSGTSYARRRTLRNAIARVDPDVVLMARLFDVYPVCAQLKSEGHRLRLTMTLQAFEPEYFVDLARYASVVDFCVTSGDLVAEAVRRVTSLPAERVRSIPGGVAPATRFVVHDRAAPLRIGYVGRLDQVQKRALDLIAFTAELQRRGVAFHLTVAGTGAVEGELRRALPGVEFAGWLSTGELYERLFPSLDVLVHFAEWEGITIAPREAMAHGVVPVISRFPGLETEAQFLDGRNALTFPVGDVAAAADCVVRLDRDRDLLERLSAAARESQGGIRSAAGAVAAWAETFQAAVAMPRRIGPVPPPPADSGRLARAGIPESFAEVVRSIRRRRHDSPGAEWPHWSGMPDETIERELCAIAAILR